MLRLTNVQKYYGGFLAIDIPSLFIEEGLWWVQGENGSGKTTFLKMIAGLHPFNGTISLNNLTITKQRQQFVKLVNYAEAEPLYPSFLTARDLVELYCQTKGGDILFAQELLKQLHVFDAYTQSIGTYSSGMIKKVSLALAFIGQPKIILLDEPLITIDASAVNAICTMINDSYKKGVSFIITSHQAVRSEQLGFTGKLLVENRTIHKNSE
ncbi:ABC transporter ATP-binding protein [Segetibacter aerophilus]|uniref:ABC transporter n=1 Tax=Segetibacter aerophilus TaxID=670293 RepID=A0A512BFA8_9BACT|nr:ABC transporter ATP-binding protein [Segetibacter aerophilus]GEO10651.1 ABC transporter [Segetibacter aerophilus]